MNGFNNIDFNFDLINDLNYYPFVYVKKHSVTKNNDSDPDNNLFNDLELSCKYYQSDDLDGFKETGKDDFSIIHFNCSVFKFITCTI